MKQIILLTGENEILKNEYLANICKKFRKEDIFTIYLDEIELENLFSELEAGEIFSNSRVFVFKNFDMIIESKKKQIKSKIEEIFNNNSNDYFIILTKDKIFDISDKIDVIEFKKYYKEDMIKYVISKLGEHKISYEDGVVEYIVDLSCENIDIIVRMIEIIKNYSGNNFKLTFQIIDSLFERENGSNIFDFIEGIFTKNIKKALISLNDLRERGESLSSINYMLNRTAKLMWAYFSDPKNINVKPYEREKLKSYSSKINMRHVSKVFELIAKLEVKSKSIDKDLSFLEIEKFILSM